MRRSITYISCFLFFISPVACLAQDDEPMYDTIISQEQVEVEVYEDPSQADDSYFKIKGSPEKIKEREVEEEKIKEIKSEDAYWYADLAPEKEEKKSPARNIATPGIFRILFWIFVIGGFVALLIWFLASGNIILFRRSAKLAAEQETEIAVEEDIFSIDYENAINKAVNAGNFRIAIRLLYLQTLKEMSERNIIRYSHEKTNSDYLFQLLKSRYYKDFFRLTRHFEYAWYGGFTLSKEAFQFVYKDFSNFKQHMG